MDVGQLYVGYLVVPGLAPQLPDKLGNCVKPTCRAVAAGQVTTVGVGGQASTYLQAAALHESAALALCAEAGVLKLDYDVDGEVVGDTRDLYVLAAHTRLPEGRVR